MGDVHSKLAPLSLNKPLPGIGGLPPLRSPTGLAPLRPPPSMGGSLSSTGGSSRPSDTLGGLGGSSRPGDILGGSSRPTDTLGGSSRPIDTLGGSRPTDTLGGSSRPGDTLGGSRGDGLDLLRSVKVSTQFEEEDTESESVSYCVLHAYKCTLLLQCLFSSFVETISLNFAGFCYFCE